MKIAFIGLTKIQYMPYLWLYLKKIDNEQHDVHIVVWNRDLKNDIKMDDNVKIHEFCYFMQDDVPKHRKINGFIRYRHYIRCFLSKESFDAIIILHSLTAVVLGLDILKEYRGKYILDYRDVTYERFPWFKRQISKLVAESYVTFISSDAFRNVLPSLPKVHLFHNMDISEIQAFEKIFEKREKANLAQPIRLCFWGLVRYYNSNMALIRKLGNDKRFKLCYYGREQDIALRLKRYCQENKIENVYFYGAYNNHERFSFIREVDLVNNVYDLDDPAVPLAVSNKYYDAVLAGIPQLCTANTFQARLVMEHEIGFAIDPNEDDLAEKIFGYFSGIERERTAFSDRCTRIKSVVINEQEKCYDIIDCFLKTPRDNGSTY